MVKKNPLTLPLTFTPNIDKNSLVTVLTSTLECIRINLKSTKNFCKKVKTTQNQKNKHLMSFYYDVSNFFVYI